MKSKKNIVSVVLLLALMLALVPTPTMAQDAVECESEYVVQADDALSTISDRFYGNVLAYPVIADATNSMSASDSSYASIENPDVIEIGWKLCILR